MNNQIAIHPLLCQNKIYNLQLKSNGHTFPSKVHQPRDPEWAYIISNNRTLFP